MTSVDRTFLIGARAFDLMRTYCLTAAPRSYELWYTFVTGLKPQLNRAVDRIVADRTKLTGGDIDSLFEAHFDSERLIAAAGQAGGEIVGEIDQVNDLIDLALCTSETYGQSLESIVAESDAGHADRERLSDMLRSLLGETRQVSETNRMLAGRFKQSREEIHRLRDELEVVQREALTDPLTGIANRRMLERALRDARESAIASSSPLTLILMDIDEFKQFNDRFGHPTGDQVLRLVAFSMKGSVQAGATIARLGGEEFVVLLPDVTLGGGHAYAETIRRDVAARELFKRSTGETLGHITVSLGVVSFDGEEAASSLLARADRCLYAAKRGGRNRSVTESDEADLAAA